MEWKPIETAPKDGSKILTFLDREDGNFDVHLSWWDGFRFCGYGWSYADWHGPSKWMPLPEPPK